MAQFQVTSPATIKTILQAFAHLDSIRWSNPPPEYLINFCSEDLTADEKLLTHWLCYICDRQMPFQRVWEIGGYVLSHLVRKFERSQRDVATLVADHVQMKDDGKIVLQSPKDGPNRRLKRLGIDNATVLFASRYVPEDTYLIFRTLSLLDRVAGRRLGRFMAMFVSDDLSVQENVNRLAAALNGLTYSASGTVSAGQLNAKLEQLPAVAAREMDTIREDPAAWLQAQQQSFRRFEKKRLWCSLRDYLKSPEFNPYLVEALSSGGVQRADRWRRDNRELKRALNELELPGDVWNNSRLFANGLFLSHIRHKPKGWNMPRTARAIYDELSGQGKDELYPEQLDVTFDFVPRMCERQMCRVCLFGGGVKDCCHNQAGLICPVALTACGYHHRCQPDHCVLKEDAVKGHCQHWEDIAAEAKS